MATYKEDSHLTYQHRGAAGSNCLRDSIRRLCKWRAHGLAETLRLPELSSARRTQSLSDDQPAETVLYLAYGSNLSNETFRGNRGIKPISQTNVQVPELRLTFDLPGIAYAEPCFANTARRDPNADVPEKPEDNGRASYHKDQWHKGLIGVVYEVTLADYATIIATEGGGSSYHDIMIDCYPFASSNPAGPVPQFPQTKSFKAHTLFAPATPPGQKPPRNGGRLQRPDTSYAQASARYLKLITDGAAECGLPYEYQDYLHNLRPYTITSPKQRIGQFIFLSLWMPLIFFIFSLQRFFADERGVAPEWLRILAGVAFQASWASYDSYFKELFGDGERTVPRTKAAIDDEEALLSTTKYKPTAREKLDLLKGGLLEV